MKLWANTNEARRQERTYFLQTLNAKADIIGKARSYENRGFQWTRRAIALTAVFFIVAFPKMVAVFMPETAVFYGYSEMGKGFLFFGSGSGAERIVWEQMRGLVITPLDTHLLAAIVGLYFGGSLTR